MHNVQKNNCYVHLQCQKILINNHAKFPYSINMFDKLNIVVSWDHFKRQCAMWSISSWMFGSSGCCFCAKLARSLFFKKSHENQWWKPFLASRLLSSTRMLECQSPLQDIGKHHQGMYIKVPTIDVLPLYFIIWEILTKISSLKSSCKGKIQSVPPPRILFHFIQSKAINFSFL